MVVGESLNENGDKEVDGGVPQSAREAQGESRQQFSIKFWPLGPCWGNFGAHFGVVWRLLEAFETQMARERRLEEVLGHSEGSSGGRLGTILGHFWATSGAILGRLGGILGRLGAILGRLRAILGNLGAPLGLQSGLLKLSRHREAEE